MASIEHGPDDRARARWRELVPAGLVVLVALLAGWRTLENGLVYDDKQLALSPLLHRPWDLLAFVRNGYYPPELDYLRLYRPLAQWSLVANAELNRWICGDALRANGFHAVNLALGALAALLVLRWLLALRVERWIALAAALLFAAHPVHVEVVANVTARSESLAFLFGMALLIALRRERIVLACACFLAALWSKESALCFLPLAIATDLFFPRERARRTWTAWLALALVAAGWLGLRAAFLTAASREEAWIDNPLALASAGERVAGALSLQLTYLRNVCAPFWLAGDYSYAQSVPARGWFDARVIAVLLLALGAGFVAWRVRRTQPLGALALVAWPILFALTANVVVPIGALVADRLAYAPSVAVCVLAACLLAQVRARVAALVATCLLSALVVAGIAWSDHLGQFWRDERTLMQWQVESAPKSAKAHINFALTLAEGPEATRAIEHFQRALEIAPDYAQAHEWLGSALARAGRRDEALAHWKRALELDASLDGARAAFAEGLLDAQRREEAAPQLAELCVRAPAHADLARLLERCARSAAPEQRQRASAELESARRALATSDWAGAHAALTRALVSGALERAQRLECFTGLARACEALGRAGLARAWQRAAALQSR